jgi:hypothetical protein
MSAPEQEREIEKFLAKAAGWKAGAAKRPAVRAEAEREEKKRDEFIFRVATLAAQINPRLFEENPATAIQLALKRLRDTKRILNEPAQKNEPKAEVEKVDLAKISVPYQRAVRWITDEKNWDRARDKFQRFLEARFTQDGEAEAWQSAHRSGGITGQEWVKLYIMSSNGGGNRRKATVRENPRWQIRNAKGA